MKQLVVLLFLLLTLGACTTERVIEPQDPKKASELNAQLGLGYLKQGDFERAEKKLEKALSYDSDNVEAHHYKAELYRRLAQYEKAEEEYKIALDLDPKNATVLNNYGVYLCDRQEYEKAIAHFDTIIQDPFYREKAAAYENIGLCQVRQGNLQKAEAAFTEALRIDPNMASSIINLAQMRYDGGRMADAYDLFRRYIKLAQHTPESLWLGILMEHDRGAKNTVASYKVLLKGKYPDSKQAQLLKKLEAQGKL
jgi:type IV pilus assembly protein PilF